MDKNESYWMDILLGVDRYDYRKRPSAKLTFDTRCVHRIDARGRGVVSRLIAKRKGRKNVQKRRNH